MKARFMEIEHRRRYPDDVHTIMHDVGGPTFFACRNFALARKAKPTSNGCTPR